MRIRPVLSTLGAGLASLVLGLSGSPTATAAGLPPGTGTSLPGAMAQRAYCIPDFDHFTANGQHITMFEEPAGLLPVTQAKWSFVPRALTRPNRTNDAPATYYAISRAGSLLRVVDTGTTMSARQVGSGWSGIHDIVAFQNRLYYVNSVGELRRRTLSSTGAVSSTSVLLRTGMSTTMQLSSGDRLAWTSSAGTSSYDVIYAVTSAGGLYQLRFRYAGTAGPSSTTARLAGGWDRFDSFDVAMCRTSKGGWAARLEARDSATSTILAYTDPDATDESFAGMTVYRPPDWIVPTATYGA